MAKRYYCQWVEQGEYEDFFFWVVFDREYLADDGRCWPIASCTARRYAIKIVEALNANGS